MTLSNKSGKWAETMTQVYWEKSVTSGHLSWLPPTSCPSCLSCDQFQLCSLIQLQLPDHSRARMYLLNRNVSSVSSGSFSGMLSQVGEDQLPHGIETQPPGTTVQEGNQDLPSRARLLTRSNRSDCIPAGRGLELAFRETEGASPDLTDLHHEKGWLGFYRSG